MTIESLLLGLTLLAVIGLGIWLWKIRSSLMPDTDSIVQKKDESIGELKQQLVELKSEKDRISGESKQLWAQNQILKKDVETVQKENERLQKVISKHEAEDDRRNKEQQDAVNKLHTSEESWKQERARIQREDEEQRQKQMEEWDRMWKEHENNVKSHIIDLCKKPELNFRTYDNDNLPEGFHGKLKPDCMVAFLEQCVIFDAKVSSSKNLQIYVNEQVKSTAQKVKGNEMIYSSIFLVVPSEALKQIKRTYFYEEGYSFFVIPPEAISPILTCFKKIENYEFAEQMDPQERENIVDLIAQFDFHISSRNAVDFALMQHGLETLARTKKMNADLTKEIAAKKAKIRNLNFNTADQKALIANPDVLETELNALTSPQPQMKIDDIRSAKKSLK